MAALIKVKDVFRSHLNFIVNDGKSSRFWFDWWNGATPLCSSFLVLFSFCGNPDISIYDLTNSGWDLAFRCSLSPVELEQWHQLDATFLTLSEIMDLVV